MKLCAAKHVIIVCAKFKVTARRFCLLDANALGAGPRYKAHVLGGVVHRFYQRFTRVLPELYFNTPVLPVFYQRAELDL